MKTFKHTILLIVTLFSLQSFAEDQSRAYLTNGLDGITISIMNYTDSVCDLEYFEIGSGYTSVTSPPRHIPAGLGGVFYLYEYFKGPDIVLDYNCGGKKISLYNQQNTSIAWAGAVHAEVIDADPGITAYADTARGSQIVIKTGKIMWFIVNQ